MGLNCTPPNFFVRKMRVASHEEDAKVVPQTVAFRVVAWGPRSMKLTLCSLVSNPVYLKATVVLQRDLTGFDIHLRSIPLSF